MLGVDGQPLAGNNALLYGEDGEPALPVPECLARVDLQGCFTFTGLPAGRFVVLVRAAEQATAKQEVLLHAGEEEEVSLHLERGVAVTLVPVWDRAASAWPYVNYRVLDASGIPLIDQFGPAEMTQALAMQWTFYLEPGSYTAEAYSNLHRPARMPFRAVEGARLELKLERR